MYVVFSASSHVSKVGSADFFPGSKRGDENEQVHEMIMSLGLPKRGTLAREGWVQNRSNREVPEDLRARDNLLAFLSVIRCRLDLTLEVGDASDRLSEEAGAQLAQMASGHETCCLRPTSEMDDVLRRKNMEFLVIVERETCGGQHDDAAGSVEDAAASQGARDASYTLHCYVCRVGFEILRCRKLPVCLDMDLTILQCTFLGTKHPKRGWEISLDHENFIEKGLTKCREILEQVKKELENVKSQGSNSEVSDRIRVKEGEIAWVLDQELLLKFTRAWKDGVQVLSVDGKEEKIHYKDGDPFVQVVHTAEHRGRPSCCVMLSHYKGRPYILYLRNGIADLLLEPGFDVFFSTHALPGLAVLYLKVRISMNMHHFDENMNQDDHSNSLLETSVPPLASKDFCWTEHMLRPASFRVLVT